MQSNLGSFRYRDLTISYRVGTEDEKVLNHSFENDIFFKEIPSYKNVDKPVIIDVGSHIGTFAIFAAIKYPNSTVYAVEASKDSFDILRKNVEDNGLNNIIPIHAALSGENGKIRLFHSDKTGNWGHSITKQFSDSFEEVNSITLQDLKEKYSIDRINLIKFNCEGAEFQILEQFKEYIKSIDLALILYHEDLVESKNSIESINSMFRINEFRTLLIRTDTNRGRGWLICWNNDVYTFYYRLFSWFKRRLLSVV